MKQRILSIEGFHSIKVELDLGEFKVSFLLSCGNKFFVISSKTFARVNVFYGDEINSLLFKKHFHVSIVNRLN